MDEATGEAFLETSEERAFWSRPPSLPVELWAEPGALRRRGPIDRAPLPYLGVSFGLHTTFLLLVLTIPVGWDPVLSAPATPPVRMVTFRPVPPPPAPPAPLPPELPEAHDLLGDGDDDVLGSASQGLEGAAGETPKPAATAKRLALRGDRKELILKKALATAIPKESGALAALSAVKLERALELDTEGEDALTSMGAVTAGARGAANGVHGLGIRGTRRSGAGSHERGISIGHVVKRASTRRGGQGVRRAVKRRAVRPLDTHIEYATGPKQGCLTAGMVRDAVRRRRNQLRACYEDALLHDQELEGRLKIELKIVGDGSVSKVAFQADTLRSASVRRCISSRLADLKFPSFTSCDSVVATYPMNFHARKDTSPRKDHR